MIGNTIKNCLKWLVLCAVAGICSGIIGAWFSLGVEAVTELRIRFDCLIYFLPLGGVLSVLVYRLFKTNGQGTNNVLKAMRGEGEVSPKLAPSIFTAALFSHLFGASVGREGAAVQIGGSLAAFLSKIFKLEKEEIRILTYCGMAGVFSAVFGTPFAAVFFALEVAVVGKIYIKAIVPTLLTSICAYFTSVFLGTRPERFKIEELGKTNALSVAKTVLIVIAAAALSIAFCYVLKFGKSFFQRLFKWEIVKIAAGAIVIVLLTLAVGTKDYSGAGTSVIEAVFAGEETQKAAFLIRFVFAAIAVSAGFKGGEIIPTLFIGATFGAFAASLLGIPTALGGLVGLTAMFCGATNCLFASIVLSLELFSGKGAGFVIMAAVISFFISGKISLYSAQKHNKKRFNLPYEFE